MAADECADRFGIYYTSDGVRIVSARTEMAVITMLRNRDLTLTEMTDESDISPSTLLFNIKKLLSRKLIGSYNSDSDRRVIKYFITSIELVSSFCNHDSVPDPESYCVYRSSEPLSISSWLVNFSSMTLLKNGINIGRISGRYGAWLMDFLSKEFVGRSQEEALNNLAKYLGAAGVRPLTVISMNPVKIRVVPEFGPFKAMADVFLCYPSMVSRVLEHCTGRPHAFTGECDADGIVFTFTPRATEQRMPAGMFSDEGLMKIVQGRVSDSFCIVLGRDNVPELVNNPVQIGILHALERAPRTLKGLCSELNLSASTLFSNLTKLEENGIVRTDRSAPGIHVYRNSHLIIMSKSSERGLDTEFIENAFLETASNPRLFMISMFRYVLILLDSFGMDFSSLQQYAGRIAMKSNVFTLRNMNVDETIAEICSIAKSVNTELTVESFIPLTISSASEFVTGGGIAFSNFYAGVFAEAIREKTGFNYIVTSMNVCANDRGHSSFRFVMEPEECFARRCGSRLR